MFCLTWQNRKGVELLANKVIRSFNKGHHSELLYNEELYKNFEATRHLLDRLPRGIYPKAKVDGALWINHRKNELCTYDTDSHVWTPLFDDTLRLIRDLVSPTEPVDPINGQLWLCDGVLYYFDGGSWIPAKAALTTDSQFNIASFGNFVMASPLWVIGNMVVKDKSTGKAIDAIDYVKQQEELEERYRQGKIDIPNNSYVIGHTMKIDEYATDDQGHILDERGNPINVFDEKGKIVVRNSNPRDIVVLQGAKPKIIGKKDAPEPWNPKDHDCGLSGLEAIPDNVALDKYAQFIAPNTDIDRVFLNDRLDHGYERRSLVHFNYDISKLVDKRHKVKIPSLVHVNPGKLVNIRKRLFKVNKLSPSIKVPAKYSEFYGFYRFERFGHFMRPMDSEGNGDYTMQSGGIFLSQTGREYDFVVALTYEYGWLTNTGSLSIKQADTDTPTYYVGANAGSANIFVNGFNLEDNLFLEDSLSRSVTIDGLQITDEITGILYNASREYGFIREVIPATNGSKQKGVIRLSSKYVQPLVFVNGLLLNANDYTYDAKRNLIFVNNADIEQPWTVLDAYDSEHKFNMLLAKGNATKNGEISYTTNEKDFAEDDNYVLFVDGIMVSRDDIRRDHKKHILYVKNLKGTSKSGIAGQEYVLLRDRYNMFYQRQELTPAVGVGNVNQALVYCNGLYVGDYTQCLTTLKEKAAAKRVEDNEIIFFADGAERSKGNTFYRTTKVRKNNWFREELEQYVRLRRKGQMPTLPFSSSEIAGTFKVYNKAEERFETFDSDYTMALIFISDNYDLLKHNVALSFSYGSADSVYIYAFRYAHAKEKTLFIGTLPQGDIQDPGNAQQKQDLCYSLYKTGPDGKWLLDSNGLPIPAEGAMLIYGKADVSTQTIMPVTNNGNNGMIFKLKKIGENSKDRYEPNVGALSVWINGIRQYDIGESSDGCSFTIPQPVCGQIQYCIESRDEDSEGLVCQREILDNTNVVQGCINVYKTEKPLFPGVVSVYIDGIRQSKSKFSIIDSNTLMINDESTHLIGSDGNNYPIETFPGISSIGDNDKWASIDHTKFRYTVKEGDPEYPYWCKAHNAGEINPMPDKILVEVRHDYGRVEKVLDFEERSGGANDIFVGSEGDFPQIPENILDSSDEVVIFLNGMFYGLSMNNGYTLDRDRLEIRIHNNEFIDAVLKDPVYDIMYDKNGNKTTQCQNFKEKNGYEYERKNEIILNWR